MLSKDNGNSARAKKILIVEDDTDILKILELIFESEGYRVVLSETGQETQDLKIIKPDLILLDIRLSASGKEGATICLRLKAQEETRHIPIILLSAETDLPTLCRECGANDYVSKPFDVAELSGKVRELVSA